MMDYNDAMEYIRRISACGIVPGLGSIKRLCGRIGNPQDKLSFVHIAGTNGKGSALAFISTVLSYGGYRVGRYISPAIFEYRERIQIDGRYISCEELCAGIEIIKSACDEIVSEGFNQPTLFEVETALAFWYFEKEKCDIVVLETGMGGAEDATNIIENTHVAVITSIGMDHRQFLGDTLEEIARQKAGIIKKGCAVVAMWQKDEVLKIVRGVAKERGCKFTVSYTAPCMENPVKGENITPCMENPVKGENITPCMENSVKGEYATPCGEKRVSNIRYGLDRQFFDYGDMKDLQISLIGKFQVDNAVLALNVIDELKERGFKVSDKAVRDGLKATEWQGRFQILRKDPYFIVDGAHNEDAAKKLVKTLDLYFTNKRFIYIMGMLRDKECEDVVFITACHADTVITVTPCNSRAMGADELAGLVVKVVGRKGMGKSAREMEDKASCPAGGNACGSADADACSLADNADRGGCACHVKAVYSMEDAVGLAFKAAGKDDVILAFGSLSFLGEITDIIKDGTTDTE